MKLLMLLGAFAGFVIGVGFGWAQQGTLPDIFWRACVATYVGGLLMRWWGRMWFRSLKAAWEQRTLMAAVTAPAARPSSSAPRT